MFNKGILGGMCVLIISIIITVFFLLQDIPNLEEKVTERKNVFFDLNYNPGGNRKNLNDTSEIFLQFSYEEDQDYNGNYKYTWFEPKPESLSIVNQLKNESIKTVVVLPIFTHSAYTPFGFYSYYEQKCDEKCLNVKIEREQPPQYNVGKNAIQILKLLDYSFISDLDIEKNPDILINYDKVILLHNEYVTQKEFDAITNHPNVVYLYPNALYAKIDYDYEKDSILLIRGHAYPSPNIDNGFNWEHDNTRPYEFDTECIDWEFIEIYNGFMLNCYPEKLIWHDKLFLETIKKF